MEDNKEKIKNELKNVVKVFENKDKIINEQKNIKITNKLKCKKNKKDKKFKNIYEIKNWNLFEEC